METLLCPKCTVCGKREYITVTDTEFRRYVSGEHIQRVFPHWTADQRELLISGTHSECWDMLFAGMDESEPNYA